MLHVGLEVAGKYFNNQLTVKDMIATLLSMHEVMDRGPETHYERGQCFSIVT